MGKKPSRCMIPLPLPQPTEDITVMVILNTSEFQEKREVQRVGLKQMKSSGKRGQRRRRKELKEKKGMERIGFIAKTDIFVKDTMTFLLKKDQPIQQDTEGEETDVGTAVQENA